jgi:hypothetical protein
MRRAALTSLLFVALGYAASAQFSLTPKFGLEQSRTSVEYNDLSSYAPLGTLSSPQVALRLDYKFKKFHGPFVGLATSRSVISYSFADPETGMTDYNASRGDMQLRIETGYQFSFKPIYFNKSNSSKSVYKSSSSNTNVVKSRCGSSATKYQCGSKSAKYKKDNRMNMRIQPLAGFAFITNPKTGVSSGIENGEAVTKYNAGNWNTAFLTGADFEFGKGSRRIFVVGFQYLKGLGNMESETITTTSTNKTTTTNLESEASAWNITLGFPITLGKNKSPKQVAVRQKEVQTVQEPKKTYQYKYKGPCGSKYRSKSQ